MRKTVDTHGLVINGLLVACSLSKRIPPEDDTMYELYYMTDSEMLVMRERHWTASQRVNKMSFSTITKHPEKIRIGYLTHPMSMQDIADWVWERLLVNRSEWEKLEAKANADLKNQGTETAG